MSKMLFTLFFITYSSFLFSQTNLQIVLESMSECSDDLSAIIDFTSGPIQEHLTLGNIELNLSESLPNDFNQLIISEDKLEFIDSKYEFYLVEFGLYENCSLSGIILKYSDNKWKLHNIIDCVYEEFDLKGYFNKNRDKFVSLQNIIKEKYSSLYIETVEVNGNLLAFKKFNMDDTLIEEIEKKFIDLSYRGSKRRKPILFSVIPELFSDAIAYEIYKDCQNNKDFESTGMNPRFSDSSGTCSSIFEATYNTNKAFRDLYNKEGIYFRLNKAFKRDSGIFFSNSNNIPSNILTDFGLVRFKKIDSNWYSYEIFSN